jgi:hypothetical protein
MFGSQRKSAVGVRLHMTVPFELVGFSSESNNWGVSHLSSNLHERTDTPHFLVRTLHLEAMLDQVGFGQVDLLKIDIEGAEAFVLPALSAGLAAHRYRAVILELHPQRLDAFCVRPFDLIELLLKNGYRGWRINHSARAFRQAAYRLPDSPAQFLDRLDKTGELDRWPHFLFLAPNVPPCW